MHNRKTSVRIKGLVRAADLTRQQLQAGVRPEEAQQFRRQVASILRDVESICARNGATPDHLPVRSRQAYWYLKELDTRKLPSPSSQTPVAVEPIISVKNVVKAGDYLADAMWRMSGPDPDATTIPEQIRKDIQTRVDAIEDICAGHNASAAALAPPSRRVYCWLRFLLAEDNLTLHLAALSRARAVIEGLQPSLRQPVSLHLTNLDSLWRTRQYSNLLLLKVNEGFLTADEEVWQALLRTSLIARDPDCDRLTRDFGESEEFSEALFELESFAGQLSTTTRGQVHDLEESFARVNAAYFQGRMPRPNLVWNHTITVQTFGHYQPSRDTVTISRSLDHPEVAASLLDHVMHHELLHKKHGATVVNGRRLVHTPAFRNDERRFAGHEAACNQLSELAQRLRGKRGR